MKKALIVLDVCLLLTVSFLNGCEDVPKESTQLSIVSFDVEPNIINQGEYANLSWEVIGASSISIDNGIGTVTLIGNMIIQPTQTTTYTLTASNVTTTKSASVTITIIPLLQFDEEVNITDTVTDICTYDFDTDETILVTYQIDYPEVTLDNLDIITANFTRQGTHATVSLKVRNSIQNKGNTQNLLKRPFAFVEYRFELSTVERGYRIDYVNQTAKIDNGIEERNLTSSDFSVVGDTLTISFNLTSPSETYLKFKAISMFVKSVEGTDTGTLYLIDNAPNLKLNAEAYAPNDYVGEPIQFVGGVEPLTGLPPYEYYWFFGDGATSTQRRPTHVYTKAGNYTYIFTVTDRAGDTDSETRTITINIH